MSLFTNISEIRKYLSIDPNTSFDTVKPYIDEAEQLYLRDLLGNAFYGDLNTKYDNSMLIVSPVALSALNQTLLPLVQRCLAYYMQLLGIPQMSVSFGNMGIRQDRGEDNDPAPRWKEENLLYNALKNGDIHADRLLLHLETAATVSNDFALWFTSPANTINSGLIVYGTAIANKWIDISNSRRIYLKLLPKIREVEKRIASKLVGQPQYDMLVTKLKAGTTTANEKLLIEMLEPIISKRALYMQLPFMRVSIANDGLWLNSDITDTRKIGFLATKPEIDELRKQLKGSSDDVMGFESDENNLQQFISDNIANYPLIAATGAFTVQPVPGPTWQPLNENPHDRFFTV